MNMGDYYQRNVKENYAKGIEKKYKMIHFEDGINEPEAEIIFEKYVIDNGWPWKMAGGHSKPVDHGNYWLIQYVESIGMVDEKADQVLIDKRTGKIQIVKVKGKSI